MARSPKDDPIYNDMKHNTWNYHAETAGNCVPDALNERKPPQISPNPSVMNDNSIYVNPSFGNEVYLNKHAYNVQSGDAAANKDDKIPFNNMPNVPRANQNYGNAMLKLSNGQSVRVFYDENNQQLIFPMSAGQYELFNHNQGVRDIPLQMPQPSHMFTLNQDFAMNNNNVHTPPTTVNQTTYPENVTNQSPTSNFLKDLLGNLEPNSTGTYSPFGQNYPLNHPDASNMNILTNNPVIEPPKNQPIKVDNSPKRNENSPLADTSNKKRIVAEVKPMRPSYSDVLAKNTKNTSPTETTRKAKPQNIETKPMNNKTNSKPEKQTNIKQDDNKHKSEKKQNTNTISSGSESGDINTDDNEKRQKPNKKSKNKRNNISRKWSSLDDITNEEESGYTHDSESQFVFIENPEKPSKKEKKSDSKSKGSDKNATTEDEFKLDEEDDQLQFVIQEGQGESGKAKKKKDGRNYHKVTKPVQDKKKNVSKLRRNKPGYLGLAQNYLEHWGGATWKALIWFMYLLSDICRMSFHLSFDLCTSVFTQTYVSSQAVWRSTKDWMSKLMELETDNGNDSTKLNANIPLPATGEEAMKRLLACKGKDPYSILGVSVTCTDEEIKRYYRRQAFLVHPDKNQQPGAEEAFKILQHAFDLIGEPERREAYERRALESRHVEAACTNCGRRHKRVLTDRPCYAARYCVQCKIRHSAKEKKNLKQLRPDCHVVQYRIVLGNKAAAASDINQRPSTGHDPNLEEFLNNLYSKSGVSANATSPKQSPPDATDAKKRRNKKPKA
ncbi:hypothetical protein HF086_004546 [Spodoptera exigua]|uniref:J domain-containing protein n=1 Tax=Spodoptera exigua TaxID=7107 RepID=A0A922M9G9_SPOEX|nr:hypothetical protein HF086_004546 [Spodoptera exigua]